MQLKSRTIYHSRIKMELVDIKSSSYIDVNIKKTEKDPKFEVGSFVRISKYKNIFAKDYTRNSSEEDFLIKKT